MFIEYSLSVLEILLKALHAALIMKQSKGAYVFCHRTAYDGNAEVWRHADGSQGLDSCSLSLMCLELWQDSN